MAYYRKPYRPRKEEEIVRVRLPREKEMFGIVEQLLGGKRMLVKCADGKRRICRVPGKLRNIWVNENDYVVLIPWTVESDKKADIVWRYRRAETEWLKNNGYLKEL